MRDTEGYDAADNSRGCYELAIATLRERLEAFRCERIGPHRLYLGDCRTILPLLGRVDAVVTDPPYGISYVTSHRNVAHAPAMLANDDVAPVDTVGMMSSLLINAGAFYLCTRFDVAEMWRQAMAQSGITLKTPIVWDKTNHTAGDLEGDYGCQTELVLFGAKGRHLLRGGRDVNLWRIPRPTFGNHPTPKPVGLMARAIRNSTDAGGVVLDAFMGEGPTGVACAKLGRRFVGIEMDAAYFETACRRVEEAHRQPDMFIEAPPKAEQLSLLGEG